MIYYIPWFIFPNDQYSPNPVMTFKTYIKLQTQEIFMLIERSYLYATKNKHKHVQRSLSVHTCYLQQTHTYFRGPIMYIHINSNKDSHLLRGSTMEMGAMSHKDLTSSWGPILYIQITPKTQRHSTHRHSTLDLHVTSNKNTYFRGPTLYTHVTSNKDSHCLEVPVSTGDK